MLGAGAAAGTSRPHRAAGIDPAAFEDGRRLGRRSAMLWSRFPTESSKGGVAMSVPITLLLLSLQTAQQPQEAALAQGVVRVCSPVGVCEEFSAAELEPRPQPARGAGLLAFIDPATGQLTEPTREQREELALLIAITESTARGEPPRFEVLPNGWVKMSGRPFAVHRRASIVSPEPAAGMCSDRSRREED